VAASPCGTTAGDAGMNARPYLSACLLAAVTIAGLVGAMVTEGWANAFFMLLTASPLALGATCCLRRADAFHKSW
jgi:hypothetical protein